MNDKPETWGLDNRPGVRDALFSVVAMFLTAALLGLAYPFPVPFSQTTTGLMGAWNAFLATIFYGLVGGFLLVPITAAGLGTLLRRGGAEGAAARVIPPAVAALTYVVVVILLFG